jgi:hypothetical protein
MSDKPQDRQAAIETIIAWREARNASEPGSKEYRELDAKLKQAEADLANLGR